MSEDRFKPPSAQVQDAHRPKGSAIKGFAMGMLVDTGGTLVFSIVLSMIYSISTSSEGRNAQQIEEALTNPDWHSWVFVAGLIGGTLFSMLGGYVCERIASRGNYGLGMALGLASTAMGLVLGGYVYSLWMNVLLALLTVVAVLIGTHLAFDRRPAPRSGANA